MGTSYLAILFLLLISPRPARAQSFARITIQPSSSTDPRAGRLQILPSGDLIGHAIQTMELLSLAYEVPDNPSPRLSSLPDSIDGQRLDIEAKVPVSLKLDTKDIAAQKRIIEQLVRKLLADRFGLVLQVRIRRMPVYALVAAKGASKLHRASVTSSDCILDSSPEGCHDFAPGFGHPLNGRAVDMSDLADYLGNWTDLPVVDHTGLNGLFSMQSRGWKPMTLPPPPPGTAATGLEFASLPPLSDVLDDFGLQLLRQEESLPLYRVVRIHQPNTK